MKLRKSTLGVQMAMVTGTLATLSLLVVGHGLRVTGGLHATFEEVATRSVRRVVLAGSIGTTRSDMAAAQRGDMLFVFAKMPEQYAVSKGRFRKNREALVAALTELRQLVTEDESRRLLEEIDSRLAVWTNAYTELEALTDAGRPEEAARFTVERIMPNYLAIGDLAEQLVVVEEGLLESQRKTAQEARQSAWWLTILLVSAVGAAVIGAVIVVRSATRQIRRAAMDLRLGSQQVAGASGQVAAASQSLAQGASEQAATLEETAASAVEITAVTRKNAEIARTVAGYMTESSRFVEQANVSLNAMVDSMGEINGSSRHISKIIRVIDEIAFQTNILALNATVEAARAGEAGMGFAVVAGEVRNLAQRSAQAAQDTAALIEESIGKSNEGSRKLDQMAKSIQQITASAVQVKVLVDEIDLGSQEQSRGIEQIAAAIGQMEQTTQSAAANAQQSAAASQELSAQALSLQESSGRLRAIVGGRSEDDSTGEPALAAVTSRSNSFTARRPARATFPLDDTERQF